MVTQLENIASRFEPKIQSALLAAFKEIKDSVTLTEIETAIKTQGITGAVNILNNLQIEAIIKKELINNINMAVTESGRMVINVIPPAGITGTVFSYNILNPITAEYIQTYELNLINKISTNTREAIRNSIQADFIAGRNPLDTARTFKDTIGLTPKQELAVRNYRTSLEGLDRSALKRKLRDKRFDSSVLRAIENKTKLSEDQIDRFVNNYRERFIQFRTNTIARTESMRAISVGEYTSAIQAVNEGAIDADIVRRFWVYQDDSKTRNFHKQIPNLNPEGVRIDQPFVTPLGPLLFPRDPSGSAANTINCRCTVVYRIID